jgi:hypothetical protein
VSATIRPDPKPRRPSWISRRGSGLAGKDDSTIGKCSNLLCAGLWERGLDSDRLWHLSRSVVLNEGSG